MEVIKLGEYIRKTRIEKSLSSRKLAEKSGVSQAYLSQLETGRNKKPTPEILRKISKGLDVPYVVLMTKAGYVDDKGNVPVESCADLLGAKPSEIEKSEKEGTMLAYGKSGWEHIEVDNTKESRTEMIDLYTLLTNNNIDLYYKDKILNDDDKIFLLDILERSIKD